MANYTGLLNIYFLFRHDGGSRNLMELLRTKWKVVDVWELILNWNLIFSGTLVWIFKTMHTKYV